MSIILYKNSGFLCDWYRHLVPRRFSFVPRIRTFHLELFSIPRFIRHENQEEQRNNKFYTPKQINSRVVQASILNNRRTFFFTFQYTSYLKKTLSKNTHRISIKIFTRDIYIYIDIHQFFFSFRFTSFPITNSFQNKNVINQPLELTLDRR